MASKTSNEEHLIEEAMRIVDVMLKPRNTDEYQGFGADLFEYIRPISVQLTPLTTLTFRLRIPEHYGNRGGMLHGGAVAMIFDNLSSIALSLWGIMMAPDDSELQRTWTMSGVSRTLNCSYVRPAPVGSEIDVTNEVVGAGKTMALVRGSMTNIETGKVLYTCEHHKAAIGGPQAKM